MLDIKAWLEGAGEPVSETCFPPGEAPGLPYIVFIDLVSAEGADMRNNLFKHSVTVERYSDTTDDNAVLEDLFNAGVIKFKKEKEWIGEEEFYMTTYDFDLIEREVIK